MKPSLLDLNVLLALAWPNHQHHAEAHRWFSREARHGWATVGFTQLGFIRLSSNPAYTPNAVSPREAATLLRDLLSHTHHQFWPMPPAANADFYAKSLGHQQVNDAYLVEVVRQRLGRLITFDHRLNVHAEGTDLVHILRISAS